MSWKVFKGFGFTQRHGGTEEDGMSTNVNENSNGAGLRGSVALCEDFGHKGRKERGGENMESTMNHQTTKLPNHQTIFARWADGAAGARGRRVEGAREAYSEARRHKEEVQVA